MAFEIQTRSQEAAA